MDKENIVIGKIGEAEAETFLKTKRFRIIGRNVNTPFGEIDIVAIDKRSIVFIEVKTRTSKCFGPPHASITKKKKGAIIRNAVYYLKRAGLLNVNSRIDVISINLNEDLEFERLEYMKSAIWLD